MTSGDAPRSAVRAGCMAVLYAAVSNIALPVLAQTAPTQGSCDTAAAQAVVENGLLGWSVRADGRLFYPNRPFGDIPHFRVDGVRSVTASGLWLAGRVDGEVHFTGTRYAGSLLPGPSETLPSDCASQDRIYSVTRSDLERLVRMGIATPDITDWPATLGAPIAEGDGHPARYDPSGGDLPAIVGEASAWWVAHDAGPDSISWNTPFVGTEFAMQVSTVLSRADLHAVAVRAHIRYTGLTTLTDAYVGYFIDPEVGDWENDKTAVDTLARVGYSYDAGSDAVYGARPPAVGVVLARGPLAGPDGIDNDRNGLVDEEGERLGLAAFVVQDEVHEGVDPYLHLQGRCFFGTQGAYPREPVEGTTDWVCDPSATGTPTPFWYSGNPVAGTGWIMDPDNYAGDQAFLLSSGPISMRPGDEQVIDWVVVWARGEDWKDSVRRLRIAARAFRDYPELLDPPTLASEYGFEPEPVELPESSGVKGLWPSPASISATLRLEVELETHVTVELFDVFGRRALLLEEGVLPPGVHDMTIPVSGLAAGLYTYRVSIGHGSTAGSLVVVR